MKTKSKDLGRRIREARINAEVTQSELADEISKTLRTVQKYESGEIEPSFAVLNQIAEVLNTDMLTLMGYPRESIHIYSMADVLYFFMLLDRKEGVHYEIMTEYQKESDHLRCSIMINNKAPEGKINNSLALVLERFRSIRERRDAGWISPSEYHVLLDQMLTSLQTLVLRDKPAENCDEEFDNYDGF